MTDQSFIPRTDLAAEALSPKEAERAGGVTLTEKNTDGIAESVMEITDGTVAARLNKPEGKYITLSFDKPWLRESDYSEQIIDALCRRLQELTPPLPEESGVLIVGLGNREITPDAIGPLTVREVNVTAHLRAENRALFDRLETNPVSAIAPGVTGQTGIETLELVKGAIRGCSPALVVIVDALAARSVDRLVTTVQLTDSGISPGSGVGNHRGAFDRSSLGVPVIAIGVPTVVDSATLVYDALERAGVGGIPDSLRAVLESGRSFFVSPKDSDIAAESLSKLLAAAINRTFSVEL
ncbi:MAG: GPR endopeptidase [Clostridia bacterium]|nr:GPR endopeptidase [Clostridia bacterium]